MEGAPSDDPGTGLEEPFWQLSMGGGSGGGEPAYPQRPGERDCDYYMRTGSCGYGDKCRYNHPRSRAIGTAAALLSGGEYPERVGQSVCQYFMKTGTCKFGASCKYHHPRQGVPVQPIQLNSSGYPLRPGEKDCSYYMKTGLCKFRATCKFHHPELADTSMAALPPAPPFFPGVQPSSVHPPSQFPAMAGWQMSSPGQLLPGSYIPGAYGSMLFCPGVVPWSSYPPPVNPGMASPGGQPSFQAGPAYGMPHELPPSVPAYPGPYQPGSSSADPSVSGQRENLFPERPGQPECQYYLKTGDCRFGAACKYDHPRERGTLKMNYSLSPLGLPLRQGAPPCTFYMQYGECKFGPSCKYDHPMGTLLSYSPSASSLVNMPPASFPTGNSVPTTTQTSSTSSSTDLRHGFMPG